jgi:transcriptional regulator with PAS, ATPase and Fis domain
MKTLTPELFKALSAYHWPGNIRELKNEVERMFILNPDRQILGVEQFDFNHLQEPPAITQKPLEQKRSGSIQQPNKESAEDPLLKILQKGFPVEHRHNQIKELFKKYKKLTKGQIIELIRIGHTTAGKDLQILIEQGFIVRRSPTKSTRTDYFEIVS